MAKDTPKVNGAESSDKPCCCPTEATQASEQFQPWAFADSFRQNSTYRWMEGNVLSLSRNIPRVSTKLGLHDIIGSWKARWGMGRKTYRIPPGLYAVGSPSPESPVLVTANYKMSFDKLRVQLHNRDVWMLVLDTKGINVWCAAGKGTFGTDEIVGRLEQERLAEVVTHRRLILPQLGATGASAHEVKARSGWKIKYGPIRSEDLTSYFDSGMKTTPQMRQVQFSFLNRLVLIPVELVMSAKYLLIAAVCLMALSGLNSHGYSFERLWSVGSRSIMLLLMAYIAGAAVTPAMLPWLPGPAFSLKGAAAGAIAILIVLGFAFSGAAIFDHWLEAGSWILLVPAVASFLAMNFTGASTYTSQSGVRNEMRIAVPAQISVTVIGTVMWLASRFV
jgi:hypothetical protein